MDFHGYFVQEALEVLEEILQQDVGVKFLKIITGAGKHSVDGKAKIKPAVREYLTKHGFRFNEPNNGVIVVSLNRSYSY